MVLGIFLIECGVKREIKLALIISEANNSEIGKSALFQREMRKKPFASATRYKIHSVQKVIFFADSNRLFRTGTPPGLSSGSKPVTGNRKSAP